MHSQLLPHTIAFAVAPLLPDTSNDGNFAPGINLDLRIGRCGYEDVKEDQRIEQQHKQPSFSALQIHQFFNQILVYQWLISGLPVPYALFLPSLGFSGQNCDHRVKMDSESERCRRTDGRKWRCSKTVVLGQKYCERHLHRGRQGSRKPVEPSECVAKPEDNRIPTNNRTTMIPFVISGKGDVLDKGSGGNSVCPYLDNGSGVQVVVDSVNEKSHDASITIGSPILGRDVRKNDSDDHANISALADSIVSSAPRGVDYADGKKLVSENVNPTKISRRKQCVTKNNHHGFVSQGFGLSPKSVLHCSAGQVGLTSDIKSVAENKHETGQQRCRRTDGKKWQCRRDAIAGQKYCEAHMHRGAKRIMLSPEPASDVPAASTQSAYVSVTVAGHPEDGINLNTVPASPRHHTIDDNSTSSTSDATTITDENISFCRSRRADLHNS